MIPDLSPALPLLAAGGSEFEGGLDSVVARALVALLLGTLVGAEREHTKGEGEVLFAGIRTFPLIGILGFVAACLSEGRGDLVFPVLSLGFAGVVVASYVLNTRSGGMGATTEIAALLVYFLGALCFDGRTLFAAALAVTATLLLSVKEKLHGMVARVSREDLYAVLKLAIVTVVVLPLLPDREMGPYDAWNPRRLWIYVVLIASVSFAGYVAVKVLGARRGIAMTGILGGVASSTAVALEFSRRSREEPALGRPLAAAVVLASTIMFPRVVVIAAVLHAPVAGRLLLPAGILTAVGVTASWLLYRGKEPVAAGGGEGKVAFSNPFELESAVKFGVLLALVFLASRAAYDHYREKGLYATSVIAGLTDVDAITVQTASEAGRRAAAAEEGGVATAPEGGPPGEGAPGGGGPAGVSVGEARAYRDAAVMAILLGMIANTVAKGCVAAALGSRDLRRHALPAFGALTAAGLLLAFLL